jgi:hypothetical protein
VRKVAIGKGTTLTAMVRDFLQSVAAREEWEKRRGIDRLYRSFTSLSRPMDKRGWTREDLYVR